MFSYSPQICVQGLNRTQRRQVLEYLLPKERRENDLCFESLSDATAGRTELELRKLAVLALHNRSEVKKFVFILYFINFFSKRPTICSCEMKFSL